MAALPGARGHCRWIDEPTPFDVTVLHAYINIYLPDPVSAVDGAARSNPSRCAKVKRGLDAGGMTRSDSVVRRMGSSPVVRNILGLLRPKTMWPCGVHRTQRATLAFIPGTDLTCAVLLS